MCVSCRLPDQYFLTVGWDDPRRKTGNFRG
jgi:hypothetical protein